VVWFVSKLHYCSNLCVRSIDSVGLNWHSHVVVEEIEASNGFIHVVDRVLMQPPNIVTALKHFPIHYGFFSLALEKTGLHRVFVSLTASTVFVPTNSAFLGLGLRTLRYLFSAEGLPYLTLVMLYHGSHDLKYSTDLISDKETTLPSLFAGRDVQVHYVNGVLYVNGEEGRIVKPLDGLGENGVYHPMNKVLLPEAEYRVLEAQVEEYYRGQASEEDKAFTELLQSFTK
jgi:uncharacterized surface protein with fasciclin (FAS1) repeats